MEIPYSAAAWTAPSTSTAGAWSLPIASTAILISGMREFTPQLSRSLPALCKSRNEDKRDAASVIHGNSDIPKKIAPLNDRVPGGDHAAPSNVVFLDLA